MRRLYDWRRIRIHRSYTIDEAAGLLDVVEGTIYRWRHQGLNVISNSRPILIDGHVLRDFVRRRRDRYKRPTGPGRFYCLRCQEARAPADNRVSLVRVGTNRTFAKGRCEKCGLEVQKAVRRGDIELALPGVAVVSENDKECQWGPR